MTLWMFIVVLLIIFLIYFIASITLSYKKKNISTKNETLVNLLRITSDDYYDFYNVLRNVNKQYKCSYKAQGQIYSNKQKKNEVLEENEYETIKKYND